MIDFDELLKQNHLAYTDLMDADGIRQVHRFWDDLMAKNEGKISDADIDEVLKTYRAMGMIADERIPHTRSAAAAPTARRSPRSVRSYRLLTSHAETPSVRHPLLVLDNQSDPQRTQLFGDFTNPKRRHGFEFKDENGLVQVWTIKAVDQRYRKFIEWLGAAHSFVRLTGVPTARGLAVVGLNASEPDDPNAAATAFDSFLQFLMARIGRSAPSAALAKDRPEAAMDPLLFLSDTANLTNFMAAAEDTLPPQIRQWAYQNLNLVQSPVVSSDEQRHAKRALSLMLRVQWLNASFPTVDPGEARRILDEELYGMNQVKQRIIETIVQINRTHTLPAYGLLLVGPAGTGKSQIAYAVARILKLPFASLNMSTIADPEALTGTPRIYTNAKPGKIVEAFVQAGSSNLVVLINELDKATTLSRSGSPADTLLTLLDGTGFIDNYIECPIPTAGIYPIATANDLSGISDPLLSRFAIIPIADYTPEERFIIFKDYVLPKILKRIGMKPEECVVLDDGIRALVERFQNEPGVRSLEQAGEHIAAHTLYCIETQGVSAVHYDRAMIRDLLDQH